MRTVWLSLAILLPIAGCTQAQLAAFEADFSARQRQAISDPAFVDGLSHTLSREIYRNYRRH